MIASTGSFIASTRPAPFSRIASRVGVSIVSTTLMMASAYSYRPQLAGTEAIVHISWSSSRFILDPGTRELVSAAQQKLLEMRAMKVVVPGREPLCHQLLKTFTSQPFA